jgi:glycosyltransferase involved in cell wall biosynthesis
VRLTIIGQGAPRQIVDLGRRFDILVAGGVKDVAPFYRMADLSVVPIRAGGGTRIKLLESASYRVPVVATRFGAAGTIFRTNREILMADDERAFSRACLKLLINRRLASRLASWAYATVRREYDSERCARRLGAQLLMLVGRGRPEDDRSVGQSR